MEQELTQPEIMPLATRSGNEIIPGHKLNYAMAPNHIEIARLMTQGMNKREIADELGISYTTVIRTTASPLFQRKLTELATMADERAASIKARLICMSERALDTIEESMESPNPKVALASAQDVLNRLGINGKDRNEDFPSMVQQTVVNNFGSVDDAVRMLESVLAPQQIVRNK